LEITSLDADISQPNQLYIQMNLMEPVGIKLQAVYDSAAYNSLPSLRTAANLVDENALYHLRGPIRQLFLDHKIHERFGVALLHKHFSIDESERIVGYYHSSTAWKVDHQGHSAPQYAGLIVPRSFRLYHGSIAPYEFGYSNSMVVPSLDHDFLKKAFEMFKQYGLDQTFGLRCIDKRVSDLSIEVTEGKTNIMLPRNSAPLSELIEALWVFGDDNEDDDRCHCREHCWPNKGDHDKDHSCG
jgi:hypothetical protein